MDDTSHRAEDGIFVGFFFSTEIFIGVPYQWMDGHKWRQIDIDNHEHISRQLSWINVIINNFREILSIKLDITYDQPKECVRIRSQSSPAPNMNGNRKVSNKLNIARRTEISQKLLISYHTIPYFLPLIKSIKFHERRKDCAARTKAIILIKRNTRVSVIWNFVWVDRKLS